MNNFVVSSRRYRPHLFAEIKGQQHVVNTLRNAVKKGQVAQAFLFCGLKGSGKTTSARILAQAINCENITAEGEPCQKCTNCSHFSSQKSLNIHELDAASHNSAEDMRQIVDQIRFHPPGGKKTVIIIDEAHMLSNAALNVLLKPLEDTPPHIVFILITTEKHKIIPTIISRCQVFEFHAIQQKDIIEQLHYVAQQENVTVEPAVFELISEKSGGALRDALSMFDLLATSEADRNVTYAKALQQLHLVDEKIYFDITEGIEQGNLAKVMLSYDQVMRLGFDGQQFITGWSQHLRNLLVARTTNTLTLLKVPTHLQEQYVKQGTNINQELLYRLLAISHEAALHYRNSPEPRLYMELVLIKASQHTSKQPVLKQATIISTAQPTVAKRYYNTVRNDEQQEVAEPAAISYKSTKKQSNAHGHPSPTTSSQKNKTPSLKELTNNAIAQKPATATNTVTPHARPKPMKKDTASAQDLPIISKDQVMPYWQTYAANLKKERNTASTLFSLPFSIEKNNIIIEIHNPLQQKEFLSLQKELTAYLQSKLHNPSLLVNTKLVEHGSKTASVKLVSPQQRLQKLATQNTAIGILQEKLDLTIL